MTQQLAIQIAEGTARINNAKAVLKALDQNAKLSHYFNADTDVASAMNVLLQGFYYPYFAEFTIKEIFDEISRRAAPEGCMSKVEWQFDEVIAPVYTSADPVIEFTRHDFNVLAGYDMKVAYEIYKLCMSMPDRIEPQGALDMIGGLEVLIYGLENPGQTFLRLLMEAQAIEVDDSGLLTDWIQQESNGHPDHAIVQFSYSDSQGTTHTVTLTEEGIHNGSFVKHGIDFQNEFVCLNKDGHKTTIKTYAVSLNPVFPKLGATPEHLLIDALERMSELLNTVAHLEKDYPKINPDDGGYDFSDHRYFITHAHAQLAK